MPHEAIWSSIAASLREDIARGAYAPGARLPTEAELSARFGVNRHTLRRALAALAEEGLVISRRGSGVFVAARPTEYRLGRRVRFHQNVTDSGRTPSRRITRLETRPGTRDETERLELTEGEAVHVIEGVSLADGLPLAAFRSVFPAGRFPSRKSRHSDSAAGPASRWPRGYARPPRRDRARSPLRWRRAISPWPRW